MADAPNIELPGVRGGSVEPPLRWTNSSSNDCGLNVVVVLVVVGSVVRIVKSRNSVVDTVGGMVTSTVVVVVVVEDLDAALAS